jgi:hypothetical protein
MTVLFTRTKFLESRCPTNDEWIKKAWHIYTKEYHSTNKKNEIMSFAGKWMDHHVE